MARSYLDDFYQSFRFLVQVDDGDPAVGYLANAGFNNVTIPEISAEAAEYREGQTTWTQKQPGVPTVGNSTFQQGVSAQGPGSGRPFYNWIIAAATGFNYASNLTIVHNHRSVTDTASRLITLVNAWPSRVKPDGDLDATSSEISIREMDVECDQVKVETAVVADPGLYVAPAAGDGNVPGIIGGGSTP